MNYLQKKKQAIIMMLAAQIIKTAQGYPVTINDSQSGAAVDYTVWGNTVTGKNLLDIPSEFTWTGLGRKNSYIPAGQYVLSWTSTIWGGASSPVILFDKNAKKIYLSNKNGGSVSFTLTQPETTIYFYTNGYSVAESKDVTSTINQLMLELGETATEYEPYTEKYVGDKTLVSDNTYKYKIPIVNSGDNGREDSLINIYLDKPLKKGESVNFGADNLPELQLFEGSNVITADTVVKPERISVDYYEKG